MQYFNNQATYDAFYTTLLRVVKISVLPLATSVQNLLIDYLRAIDPAASDWFHDNWCGDHHGRYCLCHAGFAGSNNNMGVEIDGRDIKKLCSSKLSIFLDDSFCA